MSSIEIFASSNLVPDKQDLMVLSDELLLDQNSDTATLLGTVLICFDGITVKTSEAVLTLLDNIVNEKKAKQLHSIKIPTSFIAMRHDPEDDTVEIIKADNAYYDAKTDTLSLTGNVQIDHKDNIISTKELIYKTKIRSIKSE